MQTTKSDAKLASHFQDTYGEAWKERILLGVYHITYNVLGNYQGSLESIPPDVFDGIDVLYNLVEGLYPD